VSDAGPIIHLAKIDGLELLKRIFSEVLITEEVFREVVLRGKEAGAPDAMLIEQAVEEGWIKVRKVRPPRGFKKLAENAGTEVAETCSIYLARANGLPVLIDDAAARAFASGLRLEVIGSVGVLLAAFGRGLISRKEAIRKLDGLSKVMWLGVDVYRDALAVLKKVQRI
jgi:predicted nucleic acid-binding protein